MWQRSRDFDLARNQSMDGAAKQQAMMLRRGAADARIDCTVRES
jgi:hypothetical protein